MASGPQRRMTRAWIGAAALGVAAAVALGLVLLRPDAPATPREEASFGTIRADGKLVLKVFAPKLY
jgi:hypothetical protein